MPAIVDTDEEMQESSSLSLPRCCSPGVKGAAGKKEAGRATGASEGDKIACVGGARGKGVGAGGGGQENSSTP
jgi:hypothetical protein